MTGKIEVYKDKKGEWRWRVRARNGRVLADSGEGYKRKRQCVHAIIAMAGIMWSVVDWAIEEWTGSDLPNGKNGETRAGMFGETGIKEAIRMPAKKKSKGRAKGAAKIGRRTKAKRMKRAAA